MPSGRREKPQEEDTLLSQILTATSDRASQGPVTATACPSAPGRGPAPVPTSTSPNSAPLLLSTWTQWGLSLHHASVWLFGFSFSCNGFSQPVSARTGTGTVSGCIAVSTAPAEQRRSQNQKCPCSAGSCQSDLWLEGRGTGGQSCGFPPLWGQGQSVQKSTAPQAFPQPPYGQQRGGTLPRPELQQAVSLRQMANYTAAPEDEYDVLIDGDLGVEEGDLCARSSATVLSAQQVGQVCAALFTVGLLVNLLILLILVKCKGLKHVENIYFLCVALANLCFLLPLPFWAPAAQHREGLGRAACTVLVGLHSLGLHGEALFNVLLTLHASQVRELAWACRTVTSGVVTTLIMWLVAFLVTLPETVFNLLLPQGRSSRCSFSSPHFLLVEEPSWKYFLTLKVNLLVLVLPLSVLLCGCLRARSREEPPGKFRLVCGMVSVFLLMWAPYNIVLLLSALKERLSLHACESSGKLDASIQITKIIATTHCWVNLPLYLWLDQTFRGHLCDLCRCGRSPSQPDVREATQGAVTGSWDQSTQL
ncbi:chemokine C-C motif receptor-like 2 isoform X2 [Cavia porcellus]|uniref:chemokine C-C motif receptor-like 2 isoform X2 n=1 Tax=Cavia porcellus TaxID=10141 RepID=UPI0006618DFA